MAVQDTRQKPLALTQSIVFFRAGSKDYINKSITARSIFLARIDLFAFNSLAFMGSSNGRASREIRFFVRATAYERHFRCRAQADLAIFFFGTRSRSSFERACWIGDVRSVFVFCFCFPMFVYQVKTVPHIPLYMTSTYNSKTAVQYHMTPIYNSPLTTVQYRTFTDPLL